MSDETLIEKINSAFFEQEFPADLKLVMVWLASSIVAIYIPIMNATPIRVVLALPIVLFIPGYCLITALFPKNTDINLMERIALSFGLSIAIVPLIGFGLNFTPWGIRLDPIVISLTLFTIGMVLVAHYRRTLLPSEEQFRVPFSEIVGHIRKEIFPTGDSRVDRLLSAALALAILITILTTIYVIAVPKEGERFTEFYVLGEKRMAADYPDRIIAGQNYPMFIGVGNYEYQNITYTIEIWLMYMEFDNMTNTSHIIAMDPNDRLSLTLAYNETTIIPYNLSVKKSGYNRVEFLLFKEIIPGPEVIGSDRINASYRDLHLGITVR